MECGKIPSPIWAIKSKLIFKLFCLTFTIFFFVIYFYYYKIFLPDKIFQRAYLLSKEFMQIGKGIDWRIKFACQNSEENFFIFGHPFTNSSKYIFSADGVCGRLANQIYRLASIYGIAKSANRIPALFKGHFKYCEETNLPGEVEFIFPVYWKNLLQIQSNFPFDREVDLKSNVVKFPEFGIDCCKFDDPSKYNFSSINENFIVLGRGNHHNYFQNYKYFHEYREDIRKIFKFSGNLCKKVQNYSTALFGHKNNDFKLCVHTRRGDFFNYGFESTKEFTENAANFIGAELTNENYGQKMENISIILLGEEKEFLDSLKLDKKIFSRVLIPKAQSRGEDFAFAVLNCDSMLITAPESTFTFWMAYLMPQKAPIYFNADFTKRAVHSADNFPPEWIPLAMMANGTILRRH